jgi:hypothetical protein
VSEALRCSRLGDGLHVLPWPRAALSHTKLMASTPGSPKRGGVAARQDDQPTLRLTILWMGVLFICVALIGHLVFSAVDVLWLAIAGFGVLAMGHRRS